uniref:Caspase family p20 domain-containing protein n=1 Tax=Photinus pyralis TaxID=7054 RepID=A0A1Y1JWU1_PHOPY
MPLSFFSKKSKSSKSMETSSVSKSLTITKNGESTVTTSSTSMTRQSSSTSHSSEVQVVSSSPTFDLNNIKTQGPIFDFKIPKMATDAKTFPKTYQPRPYRSACSPNFQPLTTAHSASTSNNKFNYNKPISPVPPRNVYVKNLVANPGISDLDCKLNVSVKQSAKFYDDCNESKVPVYRTRSKHRGKLLLINNVKFINDRHEREGAELDDANLTKLFQEIGFEVIRHQNLTKTDMEKKIKTFRDSTSLKKVDIGCVIVMSHGTGHERSDSTQVLCSDGLLIETTWIIDQFNSTLCKNLGAKPKIFIFQCCRGSAQDVQYDAVPLSTDQRSLSDMLLAYSTVPGFVSHRDPVHGTLYIQAVCKVFMEHAHDTHVEDLLKMVDSKLSMHVGAGLKQTSSFENRGFKTCYLHPKLSE